MVNSEPTPTQEEKAAADGGTTKTVTISAEDLQEFKPYLTYLFAKLASNALEGHAQKSAAAVVKDLIQRTPEVADSIDVPGMEKKKTAEQLKAELVKDLLRSGIDPALFDSLLSNEINRRLKVRFGVFFLAITFVFTAASYLIVILNSVFQWKIPDVAVTSLIIQAPIQLIGLLYIVARNLFPSNPVSFAQPILKRS